LPKRQDFCRTGIKLLKQAKVLVRAIAFAAATGETMITESSYLKTDEMLINMGPQHPSTHGVLRVVIRTDGEIVRGATAHIGYLHRCKEKCAEALTYPQYIPYTDRMDYIAAMSNNFAFCWAVEKLGGIESTERAEYVRVIVNELQRIASHLVAFGTYGLDMGAFTPFLYAFRERETILDIFERLCGARLTYSYGRIGGVMRDMDAKAIQMTRDFIDIFEARWNEYNDLLSMNEIFVKRTANVGVIPKDMAIAYGLTGPCLRGSGVKYDIRKADPYSIYDRFEFDVPIGEGRMGAVGDCWDRYWVRMVEMKESCRIIRQAVESLPDGPVLNPKIGKVIKTPPGEVYFRAENPRGELGFYIVSIGDKKPYRCRVRGPSFCNLSVLGDVCRNYLIADIVAIIGSIDIVLGEVDR
jgi:NADH-quinone oxidoreductase subunit D